MKELMKKALTSKASRSATMLSLTLMVTASTFQPWECCSL